MEPRLRSDQHVHVRVCLPWAPTGSTDLVGWRRVSSQLQVFYIEVDLLSTTGTCLPAPAYVRIHAGAFTRHWLHMYCMLAAPRSSCKIDDPAHNAIPDQNVPYFEFMEKRLENG